MEVPFALALERGKALKLEGSEFRLHQSRDDCARVLRGLAPRRSHRPHLRERRSCRRWCAPTAKGRRGTRRSRRSMGVSHRRAAGVVRQGARRTVRSAARGASGSARRTGSADGRAADVAARRSISSMLRASGVGASRATTRRSSTYGQALAAAGDRAAFEPLEKAAALVPITSGEDTPHAMMARLAEQLGDTDARDRGISRRCWRRITRRWRRRGVSPRSAEKSRRHRRDADARVRAHRRDRPVRSRRARRSRPAGGHGQRAATAVREFKAALALGPADTRRRSLRSRRSATCSPAVPRRRRRRRSRRSKSRRASIARRSCCSAPSRGSAPPAAGNEAAAPGSGRRRSAAVGSRRSD